MKWGLIISISGAAILFSILTFTKQLPFETPRDYETTDYIVVLTENGYTPNYLEVEKGATVSFRTERGFQHWPASDSHPVHDVYRDFDPKRELEPDEEWQFTFDKIGTWNYHDHLYSHHTGTIVVK